MAGRKILVFGAAGFIASYLIDALLDRGDEVVATDLSSEGKAWFEGREGLTWIDLDITSTADFSRLPRAPWDAVIHLAACQPANVSAAAYDPRDFIRVNVTGTLNILEFARDCGATKVIYASSHRNTQGIWAADRALKESDGIGLKHDGEYAMFSISETAAQDCVRHYQAQHGLTGIIFRLPPVYGYGPHTEIFKDGKPIKTGFQIFIERAQAGEPLEIWGDPDVGRDIVYVKDVVEAYLRAIDTPGVSGLFNITSGVYLTLRAQARTIADLFWGGPGEPQFVFRPDRPNGMDAFLYDNTKAAEVFGWRPRHDFAAMLADYQAEAARGRYRHLVEKRRKMLG